MSDDMESVQDDREEAVYARGERAALLSMLSHVLRQLGYDDVATKQAAWVTEREETIARLRDVCEDFGDNDWPDDLHLGDVVEKHLTRHLHANAVDEG
jgi:hypothetical protein